MDIQLRTSLVCSCIALLAGCQSAVDLPPDPGALILPCQWTGDIAPEGFIEPSGICWHRQRQSLFVIGDEGDIAEIRSDGELVKHKLLRAEADFEGVTHDPATGLLYVAVEEVESILEVHPETLSIRREFALPRSFEGRTRLQAGGEGIEGITFVPDPGHVQGGLFYVANQSYSLSNEQDVSAVFQVELPLRSQQGKARILGYFCPGVIDLAGLCYDAQEDQLLVISDATNTILTYSRAHELLSVQALPADYQEGITVDPNGFLYIAQDSGGIIKFKWRD